MKVKKHRPKPAFLLYGNFGGMSRNAEDLRLYDTVWRWSDHGKFEPEVVLKASRSGTYVYVELVLHTGLIDKIMVDFRSRFFIEQPTYDNDHRDHKNKKRK